MKVERNLNISCTDSIGQKRRTFTTDDKGKQNSPSFDSAYSFFNWVHKIENYVFKVELEMTTSNPL